MKKSMMMRVGVCVTAACWLASCRQEDFREVTLHVPEMKNRACAEIITKALGDELARCQAMHKTEKMTVNLEERTVTVTYDSMKAGIKNLEFAVAGAGFDAQARQSPKAVPGDPRARERLPAECGVHALGTAPEAPEAP